MPACCVEALNKIVLSNLFGESLSMIILLPRVSEVLYMLTIHVIKKSSCHANISVVTSLDL